MSALQPAIARLCRPAVVALPLLDRAMLRLQFRIKKSAGIRVSKEVFRYISDGNAARDRGDWQAARNAYHQALLLDPKLHHIRIQLGHALKHTGQLGEADAAYAVASQSCPGQMERSEEHTSELQSIMRISYAV